MVQELSNDQIIIRVDSVGAELVELIDKSTNKQYIWTADEAYWKRHSPILFPIVGSLKNKQYTHEGKTYTLSQHGFARDMEFSLASKIEDEIWYALEANDETRINYPFEFKLSVGYKLHERTVDVMWKVENLDSKEMYFSIGAHPGFMCPINKEDKRTDYAFYFKGVNQLKVQMITEQGLRSSEYKIMDLKDSYLPIDEHLFDDDALVLENSQVGEISIVDPQRNPYVTVRFDAPLVGIWSPIKKGSPFVCIEPWYGRCDGEDFSGELKDREWGNKLEAYESFNAQYQIEIK